MKLMREARPEMNLISDLDLENEVHFEPTHRE
jgi:hypothetical protein